MRVPLAAVGFTSIIAQILLMRELVATFYGNELLLGLVFMAWLAWVAVGSWGLARLAARRQSGIGTFAAGLVFAGTLLPAQMALVRDVRVLLGVTPGAFVEFGPMVAAVILIPAPLCLLIGFLFTLGTRLTVEEGGAASQAYVWESAGAVLGGALFSFLLVRWLNPFQAALLVGAVTLAVAIDLLIGGHKNRVSLRNPVFNPCLRLLISLLLFAVLAASALPLGDFLHHATLRWQWSDLAFAADSPYGRLTIQARDGQRVFFENGLLAFETQGTFPEEVVHFPLLAHPDPHSVLLIGGGVAGDLREILKHPVASVTYVELDPLLIEAARAYLPPEDVAVLRDPRVRLVLTDGRLYVKAAEKAHRTSDGLTSPFDVVILDLPEPATGALNRFYTREFFAEVQGILNPGGVFALGLPSAENYWSPELARRNGSVYHTLRAVFPEVLVLPGEHNFFLASEVPLEADPSVLAGRLTERAIETRWVTPDYIQYVFTTDRFAEVGRELEATAGVRLNADLTPICYYYDLALWLSRFYPNLRQAFPPGGPTAESANLINLGWVAVPLALGVALVRWRRGWAIPIAIAAIGLAGMMLEVVILFAFQVLHGTIYAEVSLVMTAFMAGLALGSAAGNWLLAWCEDERRKTKDDGSPALVLRLLSDERGARRALVVLLAAIVVYSGLFPLVISMTVPAPTLIFPLLALLAGALTGMAFPLAVALIRGNVARGVGMLYGADLVGGCLGALLGAVLFIPLLGISQTCGAIALVGLAGLLALV
jgi:spermidine synthase